jgi:enoyl-[acyl-carrier protein] reductase II
MIPRNVTELLGIRYPIFQGGMAWVADAKLAAAVSEAGGLGFISAMSADENYLREQIRMARELTDKPFGVNIMLLSPYASQVAEVVIEEKIPVVSTGAGNPAQFMKAWKQAGIKVIPVVASVAFARLMERAGADAVIAEGTEAGGHIGEIGTMALIPQVVDHVKIPVIAAGGIADGRGFAAAVMLGASGIQMGTRFLVAKECSIHPNYKAKVLAAKDISTIVTARRAGHPVRSLKTAFSREYYRNEALIDDAILEEQARGSLFRAAVEGDEQTGSFLAGQSCGLVAKEQTAREMIEEIYREAAELLGDHHG